MSDLALVADAPIEMDGAPVTDAPAPVTSLPRRRTVLPFAAVRFDGAPRWLVIFADLVALLIAFFVLILSMSAFEPDAIARLNGEPAGAAGAMSDPAAERGTGVALAPTVLAEAGAGARYLGSVLMQQVSAVAGSQQGRMEARAGGVVLVVPAALIAGAREGSDIYTTLQRISAAAPGRVTVFAASALGDSRSLMESVSALRLAPTGVETGFAGWLAPGEVAISIRDPRTSSQVGGAS